ncbi:ZmpA/ZmpB/ZmpC family metallo-endopeptidase [Streptococcus pneumoniae]
MNQSSNQGMWNRLLKFSIRTLAVGAVSLAVGDFWCDSHTLTRVQADILEQKSEDISVTYQYVAESELTEQEKSLIQQGLPQNTNQDQIYYLVYRAKPLATLPKTSGNSAELSLALGAVFLVIGVASLSSRKSTTEKIILSLTLLTAGGVAMQLPTINALESKSLSGYQETFVLKKGEPLPKTAEIPNFSYVGYIKGSSSVEAKGELVNEPKTVKPSSTVKEDEQTSSQGKASSPASKEESQVKPNTPSVHEDTLAPTIPKPVEMPTHSVGEEPAPTVTLPTLEVPTEPHSSVGEAPAPTVALPTLEVPSEPHSSVGTESAPTVALPTLEVPSEPHSSVGSEPVPTVALPTLEVPSEPHSSVGSEPAPTVDLPTLEVPTEPHSSVGESPAPTVALPTLEVPSEPHLSVGSEPAPTVDLPTLEVPSDPHSSVGSEPVPTVALPAMEFPEEPHSSVGSKPAPTVALPILEVPEEPHSSVGEEAAPTVDLPTLEVPVEPHSSVGSEPTPTVALPILEVPSEPHSNVGSEPAPTVDLPTLEVPTEPHSSVGSEPVPTVTLPILEVPSEPHSSVGSESAPTVDLPTLEVPSDPHSSVGSDPAPTVSLPTFEVSEEPHSSVGDSPAPTVALPALEVPEEPHTSVGDSPAPTVDLPTLEVHSSVGSDPAPTVALSSLDPATIPNYSVGDVPPLVVEKPALNPDTLPPVVDKSALEMAQNLLETTLSSELDTKGYTADSIEKYEEAKTQAISLNQEAKEILLNEEVVQSQIDKAKVQVDLAFKQLEDSKEALVVDKSSLRKAKEELEHAITAVVDTKTKTKASVLRYEEALDAAKAEQEVADGVLSNPYATVAEVTQETPKVSLALANLLAAKAALEDKQVLPVPEISISSVVGHAAEKTVTVQPMIEQAVAYQSGKVQLYHGETLIAEKALSDLDNPVTFDQLSLNTPYQVILTIQYDTKDEEGVKTLSYDYRELVTLKDETPMSLELRDITSAELYGRRENETAFRSAGRLGTRRYVTLSERPSDLSQYFVKLKSQKQLEWLLPIASITEETKDGKAVYKITADLSELKQDTANHGNLEDGYSFYVPKVNTSQANVYTSFAALRKAILANPSGLFTLGADMTADEIALENGASSYFTGEFSGTLQGKDGHTYTIYDLKAPLFETLKGATIDHVALKDVAIRSSADIGALAKEAVNARVQHVAVKGNLEAKENVGGLVSKASQTNFTHVSFVGGITGKDSIRQSHSGGIVGQMTGGQIDRAVVHADMTVHSAFPTLNNNGLVVGKTENAVSLKHLYAKGSLLELNPLTNNPFIAGGIVGYLDGSLSDAISAVKVDRGNPVHGAQYYNEATMTNIYLVEGQTSIAADREKEQTGTLLAEADLEKKLSDFGLEVPAEKQTIEAVTNFSVLPHARKDHKIAYENLEKLLPFYNKEEIVRYGNLVDEKDKLATTELLSVTPFKVNEFLTENLSQPSDVIKILLIYKDKTSEYRNVTFQKTVSNGNIFEYQVEGTNLAYTPRSYKMDVQAILEKVLPEFKKVSVSSVKDLYEISTFDTLGLNETIQKVVETIEPELKKLLATSLHVGGTQELIHQHIANYLLENKERIVLGLAYLNRWYHIQIDQTNAKDLMVFHRDFLSGATISSLDKVLAVTDKIGYLMGFQVEETYQKVLAEKEEPKDIVSYLKAYRQILAPSLSNNDWLRQTSKAYIVEEKSLAQPDASVDLFDRLDKLGNQGKLILGLLTLPNKGVFVISTLSSIALGMYDRYMDMGLEKTNPEMFKTEIERVERDIQATAVRHRSYSDFWSRMLGADKERVRKDIFVWDQYMKRGKTSTNEWYASYGPNSTDAIRNFFGLLGYWKSGSGEIDNAGAYTIGSVPTIYNVQARMLSVDGAATYTHEMTHALDRNSYFLGYGRREHLAAEAYALGLLQSVHHSADAVIGFNNMGHLDYGLHNTESDRFKSDKDLQDYLHRQLDVVYTLNYLEGQSVLKLRKDQQKMILHQLTTDQSDDRYGRIYAGAISDEEWQKIHLKTFTDLIDHNLLSNRFEDSYDVNLINKQLSRNGYFVLPLFKPIYAASENFAGAPNPVLFREMAFNLLAEKGYREGFLPYVTNQLKAASEAAGHKVLTDQFIINKIYPDGQYPTITDFKKAMYQQRIDQLGNLKSISFRYDGKFYKDVDVARLQRMMDQAMQDDLQNYNFYNSWQSSVNKLKDAIYRAYFADTQEFMTSVYKDNA